ncbi:MAG: Type 1 glutamine amidotransferase-like domain-containing protein [Clostridia bacterium]
MSKMFLVSSFKDVAKRLVECEKDLQGKTITFIPTASIVEKVDFFVASGKKALIKLGLIVDELDVSTATFEEIESKILNNDYIYITGGNTFFLLQELKRTGADKLIIKAINEGKLYVGESAGAVIVSPNIEYAKAMDSVTKAPNLKDFDALNLTQFYTVPHHTNFPFKKAVEKIIANYGDKLKLTPINNKQAIWVNEKEIEVIN